MRSDGRKLWPRVFGFHEVFHVLVIAASAVYFVFIAVTIARRAERFYVGSVVK